MEGIDFNKLSMVFRHNWYWLILIFLLVNGTALIYLRYTKNLYESNSQLKLEVKDDATELGIKNVVEDQNLNLLSGEIELIQSNLFLRQVLSSLKIDVSYYGIGRVVNEELFHNAPFYVKYSVLHASIYDTPIYVEEISDREYTIQVGEGNKITGMYDHTLSLPEVNLTISRNPTFAKGLEVGYYFTINSRESTLQYLSKNLTVEPLNYNANTIRIAFRDHNAFKAQYILNNIDTLYLLYSYQQKNLANIQKIQWLSDQLAQIEKKMEGYEDYFENFTLENKTSDLDKDVSQTILQINQLDSQRYHVTQKLNRVELLVNALETKNFEAALASRQFLPDNINRQMEALQELILKQETLKLSYREVTFAYRERQKEIETLTQKTKLQLQELQNDAKQQLIVLNQRKDHLERAFANLPDKSTEFSKNLRFYKLNEQLYLSLMESKAQFEVVQAGSVPDFQILSPANFPLTPISPKKAMIVGIALVASFVLILFISGFLYVVNNKITSLSELEYTLQLPVLGVIPASRSIRENSLFVLDQPKSMVSESLRTIRTNLDFFNIQSPRKVIAISSTVSGEGKSFIAVNLGAMIALSKKKVILLDLDMRKGKSKSLAHNSDPSKGISTILIRRNSWEECVVPTQVELFDYLPPGPHPPNPAELLLNPEFVTLLEKLRKVYDYILIDTPPVGLVADGIIAMKQADLNIYIFRANYSKRDFLMNLQRIININKFTNLTMVLNALPSTGEHKYGYGYYQEEEIRDKWKQLFNT